jgi:hypothetical protein
LIIAVWAGIEIGLSVSDAYSTGQTLADPCASGAEKGTSLGLLAFGILTPGGGESTALRHSDDFVDASQVLLRTDKQLQSKYKHAADFGVTGPYNKANAARFSAAIHQHINSADTIRINGTYRGEAVTHYLNPSTGLM